MPRHNTSKSTKTPKNSESRDAQNRKRREEIRAVLSACDSRAQELNPEAPNNVRWAALSFDLGVSVYTVENWARKGYVPKGPALALQRRYGTKIVKIEDVLAVAI